MIMCCKRMFSNIDQRNYLPIITLQASTDVRFRGSIVSISTSVARAITIICHRSVTVWYRWAATLGTVGNRDCFHHDGRRAYCIVAASDDELCTRFKNRRVPGRSAKTVVQFYIYIVIVVGLLFPSDIHNNAVYIRLLSHVSCLHAIEHYRDFVINCIRSVSESGRSALIYTR